MLAAAVPITTNSLPLTIGAQSDAQRFFQGTLDQVRVYNRALAPEEVAGLAGMRPPTGLTCQDLNTKPATTSTADKPQSKVWQYDGAWWAVFPTTSSGATSAGTWLWKLNADTLTWTEQLKLSAATNTKADVKVNGNAVHALLYAGSSTQLVSAQYNPATKTYAPWALRPDPSGIPLPDSETATIDIDTTGRMWLATQRDVTSPANARDILVYYGDPPYATWNGPITLETGTLYGDDISVVTALPALRAVGVLWGNENPAVKRFGFRLHLDTDPPGTWGRERGPCRAVSHRQRWNRHGRRPFQRGSGVRWHAVRSGQDELRHGGLSEDGCARAAAGRRVG